MKKQLWIKALSALLIVWIGAWAIGSYISSKKATADRFIKDYESSALVSSETQDTEARKQDLQKLAGVLNRMDFKERDSLRAAGKDSEFFDHLSTDERRLWIELTIEKSMTKMMQALDAMPANERKSFIEKGLAELEKGQGKKDLDRLREMDPQLIDRITKEGMAAYYQEAGVETKMDLAPLMEAMNGVLQGIRGNQWERQNKL